MKRLTPISLLALLFSILSLTACVIDGDHHRHWGW